jgi:4-amino-4-deoxy-L-arabinose transferase-like glycosyltransferase
MRRFDAAQVLALAATVVYLGLVAKQLDRPLMYDDANFALAARAVADTGLPYGNQGWMSERGDFSQREQWALWHPPLYVYAEGLLARLGGWTPTVLRLLGVLGGLATALLSWRLAAELTHGPPTMKRMAGGAAVALVMLCPLVVQSTLVLDIDFALLLPLTLLFLLAYVRLEAAPRSWLWLAPLFGLMLWSKMTNPLPLVGVIVVWQALRGKFTRAAAHALVIGVGGAALFGGSWLLVARWLGFPLDMPFGVNAVQWQDSAEVARRAYTSPGAFVEGLQSTVLWLGPGLVALGMLGLAVRTALIVWHWQVRGADLLVGVLVVFVLGYVNKNAGWLPKYQVAFAPLLACLAAPLLAYAWCARPRLFSLVSIAAALVAATVTLGQIRDDWALQRTWAIAPQDGLWLLAPIMACAVIGLRWRIPAMTALVGVFGMAVGWSLGLDAVQVRAPYQTDYWYGTTGTLQATDWVDAHLAPDQTFVAAKEVAIRSRDQRYIDQDTLLYFLSTGRQFGATWAGEPIRAMVLWDREPYVADLLPRALPAIGFQEDERFGDYVVYVPRSS